MDESITKEDLLELLRDLKSPDKEIPVLNKEEIDVLKEIIKDRQAMSRAWNWLLWGMGSLSTVIVSYGIISKVFQRLSHNY